MRSACVSLLLLVLACGKGGDPPPPSSGKFNAKPETGPNHGHDDPGEPSQAEAMYATVCATCHGMDGKGHGPASETINPKPRDYTDAKWQASITDDQIKTTILKGGAAVGKSPMMPGQPQLADHPQILEGLVAIIRGFGKK